MVSSSSRFLLAALASCALAATTTATDLVRIQRHDGADRNALLRSGVTVVAELDHSLVAFGDGAAILDQAARRGLEAQVVAPAPADATFALASRPFAERGVRHADCGTTVYAEDDWVLLRLASPLDPACRAPEGWWIQELRRSPLRPNLPPPSEFAGPGAELPRQTDPLITHMVSALTDDLAMSHWTAIVGAASTRYSTSSGCQDAAQAVHDTFTALGLSAEYQPHTGGHAPNVVATLPGTVTPEEEVILIGHLDDMPDPPDPAPGADDNASGAAMVTTLAEVMSCYQFERTVRFITVTGEEFGLYGSEDYADQAALDGDQIVAVLNADMIGWEGNGVPAHEDLDVNQNTASVWLGDLLADVAALYPTGAVVNNFTCNSMAYSDHWPFWQNGFAALCAITDNEGFCGQNGSYPVYHTSSDTIAACGTGAPAFIGSAMRAYLAAAATLAVPAGSSAQSPTGVTAAAAGANAIDLTWTPPTGATEFQVARAVGGCAAPGPWVELPPVSAPSLHDTPVSGGVDYAYTVRANDSGGLCLSMPSDCAEGVTTGACTEPPWFDGLDTATNLGEPQCGIELSWPEPNAIYCGADRTFALYRSTDPDFEPGPDTLLADGLTATTWTDHTDLVSGTTYSYAVRAVDVASGVADDNLVRRSAVPTGPVTLGTFFDDAGDTGVAQLTTAAPWAARTTGGHVAPHVYSTGPYSADQCAALVTEPLTLGAGATLSFWSSSDIEDSYDKGEVQISSDGGATWQRLEVGYPGNSSNTGDACGLPSGTTYFTGRNQGWASYSVSLAAYAGDEVQIRWLFSSDGSLQYGGWWVDEVEITQAGVPGPCSGQTAEIMTDGFESGDTSAWSGVAP